ncbi:MAG: hypothetical protein ACLGH0_01005 [Thermoanaerobaculia bacterium]
MRRLSSIVSLLTDRLRDEFGLTRLCIGGASAPALLDHLFAGNPLRMRDFDLVMVADRTVEEDLARRIGQALDSPELRFLPRYVYPRSRSRGETVLWIAGWGLIWDAKGVEVDLSIFHDDDAHDLNGLLNIDRIRVPIRPGKTLNEIAAEMLVAGCPDAAIASGLIDDPWGGYASWVHRSPVIVGWRAVQASPIECAIRIVRACANKLHLNHLHPELADPLRAAILQGHMRGDRFLRVRNFVKLLHDDRSGAELEMLHALGVFAHWLPEVGDTIAKLGHGGLIRLLNEADREGRRNEEHHLAFERAGEQGGDETSAWRLEALLLAMAPSKRTRVLEEIALAEPTFAALVRSQIPLIARRKTKRRDEDVDAVLPPPKSNELHVTVPV